VRGLFFVILLVACSKANNPVATPIDQSLFDSIKSDCKATNASLSSDRKTIHSRMTSAEAAAEDSSRQSVCLLEALKNKNLHPNYVLIVDPIRPRSATKIETPASECVRKFKANLSKNSNNEVGIAIFNDSDRMLEVTNVSKETKYEHIRQVVAYVQQNCTNVVFNMVGNEAPDQ
jgi:hypothetical protein